MMMHVSDNNLYGKPDLGRIVHLFKLGIAASVLALIGGDMILGWGAVDESLTGMDRYFSRYLTVSDVRIFLSALLGLIGITVETLCYFGVYRLIDSVSHMTAHAYRAGLIGVLAFGPLCHVICCANVYHLNAVNRIDPAHAADAALSFSKMFLVPVGVIFFVFFVLMNVVQIRAFAKGLTPYPKWCCVFCMMTGIIDIVLMRIAGNHAWAYALSTGWLSIGSLITFSGLLINMRKVRSMYEDCEAGVM